ncbi:4-hydroxythreonine-4-phosphate dehydrogenase PdxA [Paenarthrobacter sp. NPDC090520]|uniref:4-hydroxythreonine-4-phosphate dehydrogenase PdxA n=1 Tax=Paenarthrobacter sp. NPDC090520 TaxID=3364382 RepID=UPI00381DC097
MDTPPRLIIQADDYSGAAEAGQAFAAQGFTTGIALGGAGRTAPLSMGSPDVLVLDTHTRGASPTDARAAVAQALDSARRDTRTVVFKKTDSLWRGNIAAEISALNALGYHVVLAGALPQLHRTVKDGKPFVAGIPLAATDAWRAESGPAPAAVGELWEPRAAQPARLSLDTVRSAHLPARLAGLLSGHAPRIVIADGETASDLTAVADAFMALQDDNGGTIALAGTGGLAKALAASMKTIVARNAQPALRELLMDTRRRRVIAAVGSASPAARMQLDGLERNGFRTVRLQPRQLHTGAAQPLVEESAEAPNMVVTVDSSVVDPRDARNIVKALAGVVADNAHDDPAPDLILTGGETAREVLDALDIASLQPLASVQHGAVISVADDGRLVATKPGSFGTKDVLSQLYLSIRNLRSGSSPQPPADNHSPSNDGATMTSTSAHHDNRPFIAVTMGDGAGVGPEVTVGALLAENAYDDCRPVVIGDAYRLRLGAQALGATADIVEITSVPDAVFEPGRINVIDPKLLSPDLEWGKESAEAGNAAYHYIRIACELGMDGQVQGICTAPLNKAALHMAGHVYPGHTELLAHFMGIDEVSMMLSTPKVKVIHVTTHIGLIDAINKIEPGLVERTIRRGHGAMQRAGIADPKIGVCAINPHAGENGLFGYGEEAEKITPAIEKVQADGIDARGPLPADTAFFLAGRGDYDLIVAMYHDQGHGPVKVLGIEAGVNITVGLPVIRTSVDHGTAFDIAGKGVVEVGSMIEALRQAAEMSPSPAPRM